MTREFLDLLHWTTSTSLECLRSQVPRSSLLTGKDIVKLWREYFEGELNQPDRCSLYFFFYTTSNRNLVPIYVGQGECLRRIVAHLRGGLYVDQLLGVHFGGIHNRPWLLDQSVLQRFDSLSIGMAFVDSPKKLEDSFRVALRPIANTPRKADLESGCYGLEALATRWLAGPPAIPSDAEFSDLRSAHEAEIGECLQGAQMRHYFVRG